jgi:hypothetical protein
MFYHNSFNINESAPKSAAIFFDFSRFLLIFVRGERQSDPKPAPKHELFNPSEGTSPKSH